VVLGVLVRRDPSCSPDDAIACSGGGSVASTVRTFSTAGMPARPCTRLPAASVTVIAGPTGRQPCDTSGRADAPASSTPTAPRSTVRHRPTAGSSRDRTRHGDPPDERQPRQRLPGLRHEPSTGKLNGSASRRATSSEDGRTSGIPITAARPSDGITSRWNVRSVAPGRTATQTLTADRPSTPLPAPITPPALHPSVAAAPVIASARSPAAAGSGPAAKTSARSGVRPCSGTRAAATAVSAASTRSVATPMPSPKRPMAAQHDGSAAPT